MCLHVQRHPKEDGDKFLRTQAGQLRSNRDLHTLSLPQQHVANTHNSRAWELPFTNTAVFGCMLVCNACQYAELLRGQSAGKIFCGVFLPTVSYSKKTDNASCPCTVLACLMFTCKGCQGALPGDAQEASCCDGGLGLRTYAAEVGMPPAVLGPQQ